MINLVYLDMAGVKGLAEDTIGHIAGSSHGR